MSDFSCMLLKTYPSVMHMNCLVITLVIWEETVSPVKCVTPIAELTGVCFLPL